MSTRALLALYFLFAPQLARAGDRAACEAAILAAVAGRMGISQRAEVPAPAVYYSGSTSLTFLQDAVEKQWGFRPDVFANVFVPERNAVFLSEHPAYYSKVRRHPEDSLAHEFVHFLQVRYQRADLADDSLEGQAVDVQTWFREELVSGRFLPGRCLSPAPPGPALRQLMDAAPRS